MQEDQLHQYFYRRLNEWQKARVPECWMFLCLWEPLEADTLPGPQSNKLKLNRGNAKQPDIEGEGKLIAFSYSFPLHALLAFPCIHKALQLVVKLLQKFFLGGEVVWLPSAVTSIRCLKCIFFMSSNRIRSPSLRGEVIMPLCITYQSLFRNQSISFLCYLVLLCSALLSGLSFNYFASISILHSKHFTFLNMTLFICNFFTELCSVHRK